jgi:hypothetical protein
MLVVVVVIIFLQTWRASIIPLAAVPVSLVGTFAVMLALGFSINNLSLFGLVLAIGIVVDDAIVVVENVERNIALGLSPVDAARRAMSEVTGPIIATALVLSAVFVPTAFISGLTGQFYKQFAITIAISQRADGPVLQAICHYDCYFDGHLCFQFAHIIPGFVRGPAQGPSRAEGLVCAWNGAGIRVVLPTVQQPVYLGRAEIHRRSGACDSQECGDIAGLRRSSSAHGLELQ